MTMTWTPIGPLWLIAAATAALLLLLVHGCIVLSRKRVPGQSIAWLAALRIAIIIVAVLCALRPVAAIPRTVEVREDIVLLIDTSLSMAGKSMQELDTVREHLARHFNLHVYAVDKDAHAVARSAIPDGETTDLGNSLAVAAQLHGLNTSDAAPLHAVLFSDGIDHGQADAAAIAQRLGMRIDALPPTGAAPRTDAPPRLVSVQAPDRARLGATLRFVTQLVAPPSQRERTYTVELVSESDVVQRMNVTLAANQSVAPLTLHHRPTETGEHRYAVRLADQPDVAEMAMTVQVTGDRLSVLMLEGTWRWSFRFARRVIETDPTLNLTAFIERGDRMWMQYTEPSQPVQLTGLPVDMDDLSGFDVFVLGDVDPRTLPRATLTGIARLVAEGGRSLVFVAGPDMVRLGAVPEFAGLLPVVLDEGTRNAVKGPMEIRVSDDAVHAPAFFRPGEEGDALWQAVPPIERIYPVRRKKPGATVLLEAASLTNEHGPLIVAATQRYGRGRVLYVGTDALWQWQMLGPMSGGNLTPYAVLWQQILRAMSPLHVSPQQQATRWQIAPQDSVVSAGHAIHLSAKLIDVAAEAEVNVTGIATWADGSTSPLLLTRDATSPHRYRAEVHAAAPGASTLTLTARSDQQVIAESHAVINIEPPASERDDAGVDTVMLGKLVDQTGGRWIDPADKQTWPMPTQGTTREMTGVLRVALWQQYILPVLLVLLLGIDWTLRLVRGYA